MLRAQAESMMTDMCVVSRVTGATADVEVREVPVRSTVYDGRCRLQETQLLDPSQVVAGATVVTQLYQLQVPVSAGPFRIGDLAKVGGRQFRVTGLHTKTHQTAQRLPVEEVP